MYKLLTWIDKNIDDISKTSLFKKNFSDKILNEVEDVGTFYLLNEIEGIDVMFSDHLIVTAIHLYSGKYLGINKYTGDLPFDIDFSYGRKRIRELIGLPNSTSGDYMLSLLDHKHFWDKYFYDTYSLHFQFDKTEKYIELITIGSMKFEDDALPE